MLQNAPEQRAEFVIHRVCAEDTVAAGVPQLPNRTGVTALPSPGVPTLPPSSGTGEQGKCLHSWRKFIPISPGSSASSEGRKLREGKLW